MLDRSFLTLFGALFAITAQAQTAPTVQLTCAPTSAISPASVTLTWSSTGAQSCTGSGSWTGTKATSGTQTISNLSASASYALTCSAAPTPGTARLSWTPPTRNTDGSTLTDLAGYRVMHGTSATALTQTVQVASPSATTYTVTGLENGTRYFAVKAYTSGGNESALSNTVSKTIASTPGATATGQCSITVTTRPEPPTSLQVIEQTVHEIVVDWTAPRLVAGLARGRIPLGTECNPRYQISGAYYGIPRDLVVWNGAIKPQRIVARCGLVADCTSCDELRL